MPTRFVTLVDDEGIPVAPPVQVTLSELTYNPADREWEAAAIRIAVEDGLVPPERRHLVRARFEEPSHK